MMVFIKITFNLALLVAVIGALLCGLFISAYAVSLHTDNTVLMETLTPYIHATYICSVVLMVGMLVFGKKDIKDRMFGLLAPFKEHDLAHPVQTVVRRTNDTLFWIFLMGWALTGSIFIPPLLGLVYAALYAPAMYWSFTSAKKS